MACLFILSFVEVGDPACTLPHSEWCDNAPDNRTRTAIKITDQTAPGLQTAQLSDTSYKE